MFCNVGPVERLVRLLLAGAATVPVLAGRQSPRFRRRAAIAAAAELFTAATRFCPANALLGINNCRRGAPGRVAAWAALGAGLAYVFDPHAGAGRRAKLRDRLAAVSGQAGAARPAGLAGGRAPTAPVESELHGV